MNIHNKLRGLEGPILILGASGFVGANLLRKCLEVRSDVVGTIFSGNTWRLEGVPSINTIFLNLTDTISITSVFQRIKPKTIFDCSSFGAYPFESDLERIHSTNYLSLVKIFETVKSYNISAYIHAGSSSEYGLNCATPLESDALVPNSHYAVSKTAAANLITYYGKVCALPVVNLRLYSVYGSYEDSSRLIPVLCKQSLDGRLPMFGKQETARDFIHISDVVEAFIDSARGMAPEIFGESFNIGTGIKTTLSDVAIAARDIFKIDQEPSFSPGHGRNWDVENWYSNPEKARRLLGWSAKVTFKEGLNISLEWWKEFLKNKKFEELTKKKEHTSTKKSISAIIACYKDEHAIPIMYDRLIAVFTKMRIDYEIIFVNDCSPDNTETIIKEISAKDPHVIGITHTRNFGSQSAFRSGMEISSKECCVLLDGDLQDPPELIEEFIREWRAGADVVYGRRVKREMSFLLEYCYRSFYRIFAALSEFPIPKDAGDFSLMDRTVVYWLLQCKERDAFLRGLRAYIGFKQIGVDYIRPERMFGVTTNNWIKNIGWAKKGIFSFSRVPLHVMTALGGFAFAITVLLAFITMFIRLTNPQSVPKGLTYISFLIMFFGSFIILGIGLLGEYIGKIFEESKARPPFIRRSLIIGGEIKLDQFKGR